MTGDADAARLAAGAFVVLLTPDLARGEVALSERTLPRLWRAAPAGGPAGGPAATEVEADWSGRSWRPWAPCHLRAALRPDGGVDLAWIRRARLHGDGWDGEPPLGEDAESYRVAVLRDGVEVRSWTVDAPAALYAAADLATDFGAPIPASLPVEVAQGSAVWGWGVPLRRELLL